MEDNVSVSISSEFSTTEDSLTESPLVKRIALGSKSDTQEAHGTRNGLPHGLIQRGAWCICHSAGYCSLATRITNSQYYVYQQGSEGQRQWYTE